MNVLISHSWSNSSDIDRLCYLVIAIQPMLLSCHSRLGLGFVSGNDLYTMSGCRYRTLLNDRFPELDRAVNPPSTSFETEIIFCSTFAVPQRRCGRDVFTDTAKRGANVRYRYSSQSSHKDVKHIPPSTSGHHDHDQQGWQRTTII